MTGGYGREGGAVVRCLASAEVYDPAMNKWTNVGPMMDPRCGDTATTLLDGRILLVGGLGTILYDPATRTFSAAGDMNVNRCDLAP